MEGRTGPPDAHAGPVGGIALTSGFDPEHYRELFVQESRELLDALAQGLVDYGSSSEDEGEKRALLDALFRHAHSLKGMAATLGHDDEAGLAHALEDQLDRMRTGETVPLEPLVEAVDALSANVERIALGDEPRPLGPFVDRLNRASEPETATKPSPVSPKQVPEDAPDEEGKERIPTRFVPPSVRVDASRLDALMDRTAAVRIAQARLVRLLEETLEERPGYSVSEVLGSLERATTALYADALELRTLPASLVTNPLLRRARETARHHGKKIKLDVTGGELNLDRSLLEALGDPLLHLLTNAIVHGIEAPDVRHAAGKSPTGKIQVALRRKSGLLHVEIQDDGGGIDLEAVRTKAVTLGFIDASDASALADDDLIDILTRPGFTTAQELSKEAGRGVGLDAVAESVHRVGGRIEIRTHAGKGTTFALTLPPSLSLVELIPVQIAGQPYAVPASAVHQVVSLHPDELQAGKKSLLSTHGKADGNDVAPLRSLASALGLTDQPPVYPVDEGDQARIVQSAKRIKQATRHGDGGDPEGKQQRQRQRPQTRRRPSSGTVGLVIRQGDKQVVWAVDQADAPTEMIVKPLQLPAGAPTGTNGAVVTSDGRVAIVLDPTQLPASVPLAETGPVV